VFSNADDRRNSAEALHKECKTFAQSVQGICTKCAKPLHKVCNEPVLITPQDCTKSARHPHRSYLIKVIMKQARLEQATVQSA